MWDLSSLTRDQTCAPCSEALEAQSPNHRTTREVWLLLFSTGRQKSLPLPLGRIADKIEEMHLNLNIRQTMNDYFGYTNSWDIHENDTERLFII